MAERERTGRRGGADRTLLDRLPADRTAAAKATLLAALAIGVLFALQAAVGAAATSGQHPMASVSEVPVQPQASGWDEAPSTTVQLNRQNMAIPYGGGSVDEMTVRSLTNESHVAFRLSWQDPTRDANIASPENYSDAAAVMFGTGELPPITMGAVGDPVNIWYWRASWQNPTEGYGTGGMYTYPDNDTTYKPARAAGNPLSRARYERHAQNYYASGFGSTSYAPTQPVRADGTRTDDGWAVTFVRERGVGSEHDVAFTNETDIYVAFAVWNGSEDERNGQKSITLQYRTLDTQTGQLSPASGSGDGDGGDGAGGTPSGDGGSDLSLTGWMAVLVAAVVLVWTVSYWRFYE